MRRWALGPALGAQPGVRPRQLRRRPPRRRGPQRTAPGPHPDRDEPGGDRRPPPLLPAACRSVRPLPCRGVGARRRRGRCRPATDPFTGRGVLRRRVARRQVRRARRSPRARRGPPAGDGLRAPRCAEHRRRPRLGGRCRHRGGARRSGGNLAFRSRASAGRTAPRRAAGRDPRPRPRPRRRRTVRNPGALRPRRRGDQGQHVVGHVLAFHAHRLLLQPGQAQPGDRPQAPGGDGAVARARAQRGRRPAQHALRGGCPPGGRRRQPAGDQPAADLLPHPRSRPRPAGADGRQRPDRLGTGRRLLRGRRGACRWQAAVVADVDGRHGQRLPLGDRHHPGPVPPGAHR